jgi:hypothetical protein
MATRMSQVEAFLPVTALTVSGGATPSVTGQIDISRTDGNFSLFLINSGASTSLTVTYKLGYITKANYTKGTYTYITPEGGGTIVNLTALNIAAGSKHEAISVDPAQKLQFTCTNNDAMNTATVSLYVAFQET